MQKDTELVKKRNELKQTITQGRKRLLMGIIFDRINRIIQKLTRNPKPPPFYYTVVILFLIVPLPGLFTAILLNETRQFTELCIVGSVALELVVIGMVVAKLNINYVLENLRDHIIDAIESVDNLDDLREWLVSLWALQKQILFCVIFGVAVSILMIVNLSHNAGVFIGFGMTITAMIGLTFVGVPIYYIFSMLWLPARLSHYQYDLFEAYPNHSDVMRHLSLILKNYTYVIAISIAIYTFLYGVYSPLRSFNIIVLITGWLPLTIQYMNNRSAIKTITRRAKWNTLKKIECKIKTLYAEANLADKATMESLTRLTDYHHQISTSRDSAYDLRSTINFLNQLLLPLLAFGLAHIEEILKLFR